MAKGAIEFGNIVGSVLGLAIFAPQISHLTIHPVLKLIGMEKEEVVFALDAIQEPVSLYEPVYNDGTDAIFVMDQLSDEKNLDENWSNDPQNLALRKQELELRKAIAEANNFDLNLEDLKK